MPVPGSPSMTPPDDDAPNAPVSISRERARRREDSLGDAAPGDAASVAAAHVDAGSGGMLLAFPTASGRTSDDAAPAPSRGASSDSGRGRSRDRAARGGAWASRGAAASAARTEVGDASLDDDDDAELTPHQARECAVRALGRRALSAREVAERLRTAGASPALIEATCAQLIDEGSLNDTDLADAIVAKETRGGRAHGAIRQILQRRGIARDVADQALAAAADDERDRALALEFASQRFERLAMRGGAHDLDRVGQRVLGMLMRRGFAGGIARDAVAAAQAAQRTAPMP